MIIKYLVLQPDERGWYAIHDAIRENNIEAVQRIIKVKETLEQKNDIGRLPIHFAAYYGHESIIKLLLHNGAQHDVGTNKGFLPIHHAAQNGHKNTVALLLKEGTILNIVLESSHKIIGSLKYLKDIKRNLVWQKCWQRI